jgi:hypothetical protein
MESDQQQDVTDDTGSKKIATLELTEEAEAGDIAFLIEDRLEKHGDIDCVSNEDGSYGVFLP